MIFLFQAVLQAVPMQSHKRIPISEDLTIVGGLRSGKLTCVSHGHCLQQEGDEPDLHSDQMQHQEAAIDVSASPMHASVSLTISSKVLNCRAILLNDADRWDLHARMSSCKHVIKQVGIGIAVKHCVQ